MKKISPPLECGSPMYGKIENWVDIAILDFIFAIRSSNIIRLKNLTNRKNILRISWKKPVFENEGIRKISCPEWDSNLETCKFYAGKTVKTNWRGVSCSYSPVIYSSCLFFYILLQKQAKIRKTCLLQIAIFQLWVDEFSKLKGSSSRENGSSFWAQIESIVSTQ